MFPVGAFGVGVSVAALDDRLPVDRLPVEGLPSDPDPWPSRLGELLPVDQMTAEQMAGHLQRLQAVKAEIAAFETELVDGLAAKRPVSDDRQRGEVGAASGEWAARLLDVSVSEFFADELALILNCSRAEATRR